MALYHGPYFIRQLSFVVGWDSSFGTATYYWMGGLGIEPRWRRDICTRPDLPWGPPTILYNG
jgi:hypothetical protein